MTTLFGGGSAVISPCGLYRYTLTRRWGEVNRSACFVMLNPSVATADRDDPTIRRCVAFARAWGCDGLVVVNLYAFRATDPKDLKRTGYPRGPENDAYVRAAAEQCRPVVAAWGANAGAARVEEVQALLRRVGVPVYCLGLTKGGQPKHPLFVAASTPLVPYLTE